MGNRWRAGLAAWGADVKTISCAKSEHHSRASECSVRRAADEFVTVIGFSDEAGGDEGGDDVAAYAINKVET